MHRERLAEASKKSLAIFLSLSLLPWQSLGLFLTVVLAAAPAAHAQECDSSKEDCSKKVKVEGPTEQELARQAQEAAVETGRPAMKAPASICSLKQRVLSATSNLSSEGWKTSCRAWTPPS